jgi:hypothetical protein
MDVTVGFPNSDRDVEIQSVWETAWAYGVRNMGRMGTIT